MNLNDHLDKLPEDMLFEIKQYFCSCSECQEIIKEEEILEKCDACKSVWCCSNGNTSKKYFEFTLNLCNNCFGKLKPNRVLRKRRENIRPYNPLDT